MREFLRKHTGSVALSSVLHLAIVAALTFGGIHFSKARRASAPVQEAIETVMLDQTLVDKEIERLQALDRAEIEARQQEEREAREAAEAARREREREERQLQEAREARERAEREEQQRQAEIVLQRQREAEEKQAREEAERQERERLAEEKRKAEEAERARQEAEEAARREQERLAEEKRQAEEAERRRREAEEARQQAELERELQEALAAEDELRRARESGELDRYLRQIQARIESNWIPPASAAPGLECVVNVTQIPSGDVVGVSVGRCNGDAAVRRSIEAAVLRASPLPTPSIPALFDRNLEVTFRPQF